MRLTHLKDLEIFLTLCQTQNMSAAARILGVSTAQVSKRLKVLEHQLGASLFYRSTRKLSLTNAAEVFRPYAQKALQCLAEGELQLQQPEQIQGRLRLTTSIGFGNLYILPLMEKFMARYPAVQVQLHLDDVHVNLIEQGFDLAIRFGEMPDSGLVAQRLFQGHRLICASPDYLRSVGGRIQHPRELGEQPCIVLNQKNLWYFKKNDEAITVQVQSNISLNSGEAVKSLVLAGKGLSQIAYWHVKNELQRGDLVSVLPDWEVVPPLSAWLVYPSQELKSPPLRAFIEMAREALGALGDP